MEDKIIQRLTSEAIQLLKEMIAIPSPSFHEDQVCSHISDWLASKGVEHERIGNNIIAEHVVDPSKPTLMLCAHIDTVSPCEGYTFDPYKPENCPEGMIQGLGSNDDGASVVSMLAVYRYLSIRSFAQDDRGKDCHVADAPRNDVPMAYALNIPDGQWHTLRALESGTVILEMKDGAYEPISPADILSM